MSSICDRIDDDYEDYCDWCEKLKVTPVGKSQEFYKHWELLQQRELEIIHHIYGDKYVTKK